MKKFTGFIKKEFYHILRDGRTLLILFGLPISLVVIFGFVLDNDLKNIPIAVLDNSHDELSHRLADKLVASGYFQVDQQLMSYKEIEPAFQRGKIKMPVIIPPRFSDALYHERMAQVQLVADATDPNTATTTSAYAQQIINAFQREYLGQNQPPYHIEGKAQMIFNPRLVSVYMFVPGVISVIMLIISAMLTSITLAREKEFGTMELLSISPLRPWQIVLGKVVPYILISIINCVIILLLGVFMFGMPMNGSLFVLSMVCFLYIVTALSLGVLISTIVETQQAAMFASMITMMMPSLLLSGFIFPVESMPALLQYISQVIPATHFIDIIRAVMIKGAGWSVILKPVIILFAETLFFLALSIRNFTKQYS
jgi:ABC-2 type transport system permease protein